MSEIIFTSVFYSLDDVQYKLELTGENYVGINAAITGGSGNTYYVAGDWTDYLNNTTQSLTLVETGVGSTNSPVVLFSYNSGSDRTEIDVADLYDAKYDTLESVAYFPSFSPDILGIETAWDKEGDIILKAIKSSSTTFTYANNAAWFDRFFESYKESNDDELKVQLYKYNGASYDLDWAGNIVIDLVEYDNIGKPRPYTFKAIDGFDMLKDVPYADALTGTSNQPLIAHLITVLSYFNLSQFWDAADTYVRESIEYTSNDVAGLDSADSPLEYTFLDDRRLLELNDQDTLVAMDCYDVLAAILELMTCRIFHAKGIYYIQQIRNFDNATVISYRDFKKSIGAASTSGTYTHKKTLGRPTEGKDAIVMSGNKIGYLPGLLNTKIAANVTNEVVVSAEGKLLTNKNTSDSVTIELGSVTGGTGGVINIWLRVEDLGGRATTLNYNLDVKVEIDAGTWYVKGNDMIPPYWSDNGLTPEQFWIRNVRKTTIGNVTFMEFRTPEIEFTKEDTTITITYTLQDWGLIAAGATKEFFKVIVDGVAAPSGEFEEEVNVGNPNSNYTKELDLGTLLIDDVEEFTSIVALQVDEEFTTANPESLINSTTWDAGFDTDYRLYITRVEEAMSLQYRPIERLIGKMEGSMYPFNSLDYDSKVFFFNGYTHNYATDEYEGEWIEQTNARTGVTPTIITKIKGKHQEGTKDGEDKGWQDEMREVTVVLGTADSTTSAGTITSISINATGHFRLKSGDTVQFLHPVSNAVVEEVVLSADLSDVTTSLTIVEQATTNDITEGMIMMLKTAENVESNKVRFETAQFKDSVTYPESNASVVGNDLEIKFKGEHMYIRDSASVWWRFTGSSSWTEVFNLVTETGDNIITETSDQLITE